MRVRSHCANHSPTGNDIGAIKLIRKVGGLMKAQSQSRQFGDYLVELHVQFKPRRNFIKLLDEVARTDGE